MHFSSKIVFFLYKFLTLILAPVGVAFLCYKKRLDPPYGKRVFELLGFYPYKLKNCIWFHAASVGEINSLKPLILKFQKVNPNKTILITTMTTTGGIAASNIPNVHTFFMPLDSPCVIKRFFNNFKPKFLFIVDTELWPNMLQGALKNKCKVIIVNGRMQEKNCQKYLKFKNLVKDIIATPLYKVICISKEDAQRFERIGIDTNKIKVAGNIKYDLNLNFEPFHKGRKIKATFNGMVLCCASTHDGEESICLEVFKALKTKIPSLKLVAVPRHKTGVYLFEKKLSNQNLSYIKKSQIKNSLEYQNNEIILGDTMGEMSFYFGLSDLVFMGGSFVPIGGHNPLEPAYFSMPTITGPDYHNFKDQFKMLITQEGAFEVQNQSEFITKSLELLRSPDKIKLSGEHALEILNLGRGSTDKILKEIAEDLSA